MLRYCIIINITKVVQTEEVTKPGYVSETHILKVRLFCFVGLSSRTIKYDTKPTCAATAVITHTSCVFDLPSATFCLKNNNFHPQGCPVLYINQFL